MRWWILLVLLMLPVISAEQIVVNSNDWRDVYSGLQYAASTNQSAYFVTNQQQGQQLITVMRGDSEITLITGRQQAMPGFRALLQANGFSVSERTSRDPISTNLDLAIQAPTKNLVIVGDAYGYNALSVATYANANDASVLFADPDVIDIINEKQPDEILLYGHIPPEIYELLTPYNPLVINEQDRFEDNFVLLERFLKQFPDNKVLLLTNGEFIESQLISGAFPLLFTGRQNVPDEVIDFIKDNDIRTAVLVGNSLAPNARYIKEETGISIFIKFAQGRNQQQYSLDLFPLPTPNPLIRIDRSEYDQASRSLLLTATNPGEVATYFTISVSSDTETVDSSSPTFLSPQSYKTISLLMDDPGNNPLYTLLYGASPNSLEYLVQGELNITRIEISDSSNIEIIDAWYDRGKASVITEIENTGNKDVFILVEVSDIRSGADRVRVGNEIEKITPGKIKEIVLPLELTEDDQARNRELSIEAFYGEREFSLVKSKRATFPFEVRGTSFPLIYIGIAVLVAIILMWFVSRRKAKRW